SGPPDPPGAALSSGAPAVVDPTGTDGGTAPSPSVGPTTPGATPTATGGQPGDTTLTSDGGSVVARGSGTDGYVVSWQPAAGYSVKKAEHGPKPQVQVSFDPDDKGAKNVTMHVSCSNGVPTTKNT